VTGAGPGEDQIRTAKETGLRNLPLTVLARNEIWCAIIALASDLLAWMGMLALTDHEVRRWEPNDSDSDCSRSRSWPAPGDAPGSDWQTERPGTPGSTTLRARVTPS